MEAASKQTTHDTSGSVASTAEHRPVHEGQEQEGHGTKKADRAATPRSRTRGKKSDKTNKPDDDNAVANELTGKMTAWKRRVAR